MFAPGVSQLRSTQVARRVACQGGAADLVAIGNY